MLPEPTTTGFRVMGDLPWGTHFCYFYENKQDLIDASVPFFQAGLENHEFCSWGVSAPVTEADALHALRESIPGLDRHLAEGAMEIVVYPKPLFDGDFPEPRASLRCLREKLDDALARGYTGMRVAGSPACLQKASTEYFHQFERELGNSAANHRIIALCHFPAGESSAAEILDAAHVHQFVIARRQADWEVIETPGVRDATAESAQFHEQFEERVEERTRALEAVNEKLRKEIARREQVEEDLRRQKEILQSIFDHVPLIMKFSDKEGRIQMVNKEWERLHGRTLDEVVNSDMDILVERYPDPVERQRVLDFTANSNGEWADFKTKGKDGRLIDTSWAVARLSDGATICIGQDISERTRAEQELRRQKEILQRIFDQVPVMLSFVDQNHRVQLVNPEWQRTHGWSLEEIQGQDIDVIVKECYPDAEYREHFYDFVANSSTTWTDFKTRVRDGRVIDTSWVILHLSDGTRIGIGQDISDRKRAEQELRKQKEILQTIFDHIPVSISFIDKMGQLQMVNREWERLVGHTLDEIKNQNLDFIAEGYPDPLDRQRAVDLLANSTSEWQDFESRCKDGRVAQTTWACIRLSDGSKIGIGQDITDRKHADQELRKQKEILQTIFDHIPVMISFGYDFVNREWEKTLGWSLEEIHRDKVDLLAENYPNPQVLESVRDFVAHSNGEWRDFKTRVRDGRVIDTSWVMHRLSDGTEIAIGQDISERKRAEQELRRQKEILQTIFDHIPLMINFGDKDFGLQLVNREWEQTLGWSLEEMLGGKVDILAENYPDPEYRKQVSEFVYHSNGEWRDFKTTVRDGRVIDTSWVMLHLPDGTSIGIGQDITQRKRAEEALRESEERFRQLAENIQALFWIKTPDFKRVLYLSPAYESIMGRSREELYRDQDYQPFLAMIHPEDRERMAQIMRTRAVEEYDIDYRIVQPDGSLRWIRDRAFPIRDQSGWIYRIAGIAYDVTERKLAEEALRESEERFRQLTENIREVFWLRSPDLKQMLYVSPMYEKVCGRSSEVLYAKGIDLETIHPEDRSQVIEAMQRFRGQEFEIEYRIITKEGAVRWLRDRGFPIRNQHGQIYRIGGVAEDITDRKKAEERLQASSEQLRALSASLQSAREKEAKRIARKIHDELGGILSGLRWELEAVEKMIHQPADAERLKAMEDKLAAMVGLTDTTINVVRRIASELRPSILDDLGLVEAVEWQTQQFQARTGIECHCDCSLQSIPLSDEQCTTVFRIVQEALTNILRHAQATRVAVTMKEVNGIIELKVSDNGRGITQAEMSNKKSLGLLGMRERAHLIGGQLDIVGLRGGGTTVHVRAPLARQDSEGAG